MERSHLLSVLQISKFRKAPRTEPRKSDNDILYLQEPVGYEFFKDSNIDKILLRMIMKPKLEFNDLFVIMERIYWTHGTAEINGGLTSEEKGKVKTKVGWMNDRVVEEALKTYANRRVVQDNYQEILTRPNDFAPRPSYVAVKGQKAIQNPLYKSKSQTVTNQPFMFEPLSFRNDVTSSGFQIPQLYEL